MNLDTASILRSPRQAQLAFNVLNNRGQGFDPTGELEGWTLVRTAETTDDVSVYRTDDGLFLVGTDGTGDDDSRWAVRVE